MNNDLGNLFDDVEPAPFNSGKGRIMSYATMIALTLRAIVTFCLKGQHFTAAMVLDSVPELKVAYKTPNAVGTSLGSGVKRQGLRLWRGSDGRFSPSFENAVLALRRMEPPVIEDLARQLGHGDVQGLALAVKGLGRASAFLSK